MMSREMGKAITHALADVAYDLGYIQRHLDHAQEILAPSVIRNDDQGRHTAYYDPSGVALVISPRNYPSSQRVREIIPALLAGNTIIYKPASACMMTAQMLTQALQLSLPPDVVQSVYGSGDVVGDALLGLSIDIVICT